jgi:hypothetical protein
MPMILNIPDKMMSDLDVIIKYQNSALIHLICEEYKENGNEKCIPRALIRKFIIENKK